jgi:hypothetical protein
MKHRVVTALGWFSLLIAVSSLVATIVITYVEMNPFTTEKIGAIILYPPLLSLVCGIAAWRTRAGRLGAVLSLLGVLAIILGLRALLPAWMRLP